MQQYSQQSSNQESKYVIVDAWPRPLSIASVGNPSMLTEFELAARCHRKGNVMTRVLIAEPELVRLDQWRVLGVASEHLCATMDAPHHHVPSSASDLVADVSSDEDISGGVVGPSVEGMFSGLGRGPSSAPHAPAATATRTHDAAAPRYDAREEPLVSITDIIIREIAADKEDEALLT